jgi:hypothetical protein
MDDSVAHKHETLREWLAANPRIHVHVTPTLWVPNRSSMSCDLGILADQSIKSIMVCRGHERLMAWEGRVGWWGVVGSGGIGGS